MPFIFQAGLGYVCITMISAVWRLKEIECSSRLMRTQELMKRVS